MTKKRSASEKAPAYQWYPKDYEADEAVCFMTYEQEGIYRKLLDRQWNEGSIPADPLKIAALLPKIQVDRFLTECWPALVSKFVARQSDGRFINLRLERQRAIQKQFHDLGVEGGQASAAARTVEPQPSITVEPCEPSTVEPNEDIPVDTHGKPPIFISDLQSAVQEVQKESGDQHPRYEQPTVITLTVDQPTRDKAVRFVERFTQLYAMYRNGAIYHMRPAKDYERALSLVKTFDPVRLEQLAVVFLNSNEQFIEKTDRSMSVFESKVTWCDEQLRKAEARARDPSRRMA